MYLSFDGRTQREATGQLQRAERIDDGRETSERNSGHCGNRRETKDATSNSIGAASCKEAIDVRLMQVSSTDLAVRTASAC